MIKSLFTIKLRFDKEATILTIFSTIVLMVDWYTLVTTGSKAIDRILLYFVLSLLLIIFVLRKSPAEYGFTFGEWKAGLALTLIGVLVSSPIIWWAVQRPNMQAYYGNTLSPLTPLLTFADLIGWEFLFRGLFLFGYARAFGANALWLHAVPFAFAHLGKPPLETLSTLFGGFIFGLVAWRTKSFVYPFLIHWYIFTLIVVLAGNAG